MQIVDNYEAKIWLGLRSGYTDHYNVDQDVKEFIKKWCIEIGQAVNVSPTEFIYPHGWEPGLVIGFINYPRFPLSQAEIKNRALELGKLLMEKFNQYRVSVTIYPSIPNGVIMLENENLKTEK